MPVRKFRSVEEMKAADNRRPNDLESLRTFAYVQAMAARLVPRRFPAGVYKHRNIEELNRQTEAWANDPATYLHPRSAAPPVDDHQAAKTPPE
ncbi:MAG: hypothetical protein H6744_15095 [Deltaproteobacteria bacterium]|nr:hypothetical protein [Deltaproteobacteria bacterium]MCB9788007.1 hypothetical protein [Deltaproteobacteria bacterium]